jgi:patatin-like phospholipase/acyl hydrolase
MAKSRIISCDGGGIRGLLTIILIDRLQDEFPGLLDRTTLYAGTSTGGIIAICLAKGISPSQIRHLYYAKGPEVFKRNWLSPTGIFGARYKAKGLQKELHALLGDATLEHLNKRVLIPTFDLDNDKEGANRTWKPKFFTNFGEEEPDLNVSAVDACMATGAAPTYFPSHAGYIDGGVFAANPSTCAVVEILNTGEADSDKVPLGKIVQLSIGTGQTPRWVEGKRKNWGIFQWGKSLVSITLQGVAGVNHHQTKHLLGPRYHRLDPTLVPGVGLDGYEDVDRLVEVAEAVNLEETISWLKRHWK